MIAERHPLLIDIISEQKTSCQNPPGPVLIKELMKHHTRSLFIEWHEPVTLEMISAFSQFVPQKVKVNLIIRKQGEECTESQSKKTRQCRLRKRDHIDKMKMLHMSDLLGALVYYGFDLNEYKHDSDSVFISLYKTREKSDDLIQRGWFISIPRVGLGGKVFKLYKIRTMYPFARYLHTFMVRTHGFDHSCKIDSDFRITPLGKYLRKFFLDELAQIMNILKGDMTLIGVRPLCQETLALYPPDLQNLRLKFKPGLLPPFYADLPRNYKELFESERNYLNSKYQSPFKTDIKLVAKIIYNLVTYKKRQVTLESSCHSI
jgi:lipopolysaccharide/colanic/teichoic acid biosynthesis glycosyltransferase